MPSNVRAPLCTGTIGTPSGRSQKSGVSALGQKQTFAAQNGMSALPHHLVYLFDHPISDSE
jgi:hypothetical protein